MSQLGSSSKKAVVGGGLDWQTRWFKKRKITAADSCMALSADLISQFENPESSLSIKGSSIDAQVSDLLSSGLVSITFVFFWFRL